MQIRSIESELGSLAYHGRGIMLGRSADGQHAVIVYFIMGRSENSRNRVFVEEGDGIRTQAYDPAKVVDPHLIIYAPVRVLGNKTIVTNGDQTDTIYEGMDRQLTFEQALRTREFEDDAPNYTPRISGIVHRGSDGSDEMNFALSILKSAEGDPSSCQRFTYAYAHPQPGCLRFIHTYRADAEPLPSFEGEPKLLALPPMDIDALTSHIWHCLNGQNRVSLFVRYLRLSDGHCESRIINKNQGEMA